jgi:hypothetical protein
VIRDGRTELVYETMLGWHPQKKSIEFNSYSAWDSYYSGTAEGDAAKVEFQWDGFTGDKVVPYRQTIRFVDQDHYEWTVFTKTDAGWEQSKQTTFTRVS